MGFSVSPFLNGRPQKFCSPISPVVEQNYGLKGLNGSGVHKISSRGEGVP